MVYLLILAVASCVAYGLYREHVRIKDEIHAEWRVITATLHAQLESVSFELGAAEEKFAFIKSQLIQKLEAEAEAKAQAIVDAVKPITAICSKCAMEVKQFFLDGSNNPVCSTCDSSTYKASTKS